MYRRSLPDGDCLVFTGHLNASGYGVVKTPTGAALAHRVTFEDAYGPIPEGLEIDHLCRRRDCISPVHLDAVPHEENMRRGRAGAPQRAKTHCPQGHPYDEENTYSLITRNGYVNRLCRSCRREKRRQRSLN